MAQNQEARILFGLMSEITAALIDVSKILESRFGLPGFRRGSDIRKFQGPTDIGREVYDYESFVEITVGPDDFFWLVALRLTSKAWELDRYIQKCSTDGAQTISGFATQRFDSIEKLAAALPSCLAEFSESARKIELPIE
jgi:hypothetical protein